jgi:hypothetical protein
MVRQTSASAEQALKHYGDPKLSLAELRRALDKHLPSGGLADSVLVTISNHRREAGTLSGLDWLLSKREDAHHLLGDC